MGGVVIIDLAIAWLGAIATLVGLDDWQRLAGVLVVVLLIGQWRWGLRKLRQPGGASSYFDDLDGRAPRAMPGVYTRRH